MTQNLRGFDRFVRFLLGAIFLFAAAALFVHPIARLFSAGFGLFACWEGLVAFCPLQSRLGARAKSQPLSTETTSLTVLISIQLVLAYEWFMGGLEKIADPTFVQGIGGTLAKFASNNPFPWYKAYLTDVASVYAGPLAQAVQWGELATGVGLAVAAVWILYTKNETEKRPGLWLSVASLFGGIVMSVNFYFAAGWLSPSTHGLNLVMFWTQAFLTYVWLSRLTTDGFVKKSR